MSRRDEAPQRSAAKAPVNVRAEKALIGALLRSADEYWAIAELIDASHLSVPLHRDIFTAIKGLCESNGNFSLTALQTKLPEEDDQNIPMQGVLLALLENARDAGSATDYASEIKEGAERRRLISIGEEIVKLASAGDRASIDIATDASQKIAEVQGGKRSEVLTIGQLAMRSLQNAGEVFRNPQARPGFDTGLRELDRILGTMRRGRLYFIGGGEKTGKTALATQIWERCDVPSMMLQGEMPESDMGDRILSSDSRVPVSMIADGKFNEFEYGELRDSCERLQNDKRLFYKFEGESISALRHRVAAEKRKRPDLGFVIVDHLLLVNPDKEYDNEFRGIGKVVVGLKAMAIALDVCLVVMTHRTRGSQDRNDPTPFASDFFGGGMIERTCDALICLYSKERWLELRRPDGKGEKAQDAWDAQMNAARGKFQVALLAHRHAPFPRIVDLGWDGSITRFKDAA